MEKRDYAQEPPRAREYELDPSHQPSFRGSYYHLRSTHIDFQRSKEDHECLGENYLG